jgi:hypothetical protein
MCLAVYLASNQSLPAIPWKKEEPAFYLESTPPDEVIRRRFSKSFVYYAGSHEGCGCGFSKDGKADEDLARSQEDYVALANVLRTALACGAELELFTCWEGEQSFEPETSSSVTPKELEAPDYELQQLGFVEIHATDA